MNLDAERRRYAYHNIVPQQAFNTPNVRIVASVGGNIALAVPTTHTPMPNKYKDINTRYNRNLKNFPANKLNKLHGRFNQVTKSELIEFIMHGYYSYFSNEMKNNNNAPKIRRYIHYVVSLLTTRNRFNNRKIPVEQFYNLLTRLNKQTLVTIAKILEW